jgi:peptidoglycan-N-acetylglucosamine deacetylase
VRAMSDTSNPPRNAEAAAAWRPRQVLRRAAVGLLPRRVLVARGNPAAATVYLTFDDGPDPRHTPAVLDALARQGAVATFFVIGEKAQSHPDLVRRIVAEGHALGHHSFTHSEPTRTSASRLLSELRQTQELFGRAANRATRLFRPPHGRITASKLWRLWRAGFTTVLWNRDSKDYERDSVDDLAEWARARPLQAGDVLLMHDVNPRTPQVLGAIVESCRSRGLTAATVDRLVPPAS